MPRPFKCRYIRCEPDVWYFKPRGIPLTRLDEVNMTVDEFESIRLVDIEGLYQDEAAKEMNVSRQTFGNIVKSAHRKIAEALVQGKAIKIKGGVYQMAEMKKFRCYECNNIGLESVPSVRAETSTGPKKKGGMYEEEDGDVEEDDAGERRYENMYTNSKCQRAIFKSVRSVWRCTLFCDL